MEIIEIIVYRLDIIAVLVVLFSLIHEIDTFILKYNSFDSSIKFFNQQKVN